MGMFSRKESTGTKSGRPSSDDQLVDMRNKARHRLIGAVVLVLAAIILIPVLLSDQTTEEPDQLVNVIPSIIPPSEEQYRLSESLEQPIFENDGINNKEEGIIESSNELEVMPPPDFVEPAPEPEVSATVKPEPKPEPKPKPKPDPKPEPTPKPKPKPARTDDGAVALALLEGRTPPPTSKPAPAQSEQGSFVLQIGAYSSQSDANARRGKLASAGVSNAYVETATVSGKAAYRLRVGPFPNRQAVQAAQARLRSLGYENSFISAR